MMTTIIKNRAEIVEQLAEMLKNFDRKLNQYQTDVYMYIDEEGTATLDTFVNVGGNSWLNDDHYTIYCDREHNETIIDIWTTIGALAGALDIEYDTLIKAVSKYYDIDTEDVRWYEVSDYVNDHEELFEKLEETYGNYLDELTSEYMERAEAIFSEWEDEQGEEW